MLSVNFADLASVLRAPAAAAEAWMDEGDDEPETPPRVPAVRCPVLEPGLTREELIRRARVTLSEARAIETYEQGTEPWYLSRRGSQTRLPDGRLWSDTQPSPQRFLPARLTASNFGTAVGHNKYTGPDALVADMLWGTVVSNEAMRYGTATEPVACDVFEGAMFFLSGGAISVEHRGLMLACPGLLQEASKTTEEGRAAAPEPTFEGWCGTSPDGIVHDRRNPAGPPWLLEIKCPSVNKRTFYDERRGNEAFGIPHYYYDQIQGIMGLQRLPFAWFVVHLPERTQISLYRFDAAYYAELMAGMRAFWFDRYLPAALACAHGRLLVGGTEPIEPDAAAGPLHPDAAAAEDLPTDIDDEISALISADLADLERADFGSVVEALRGRAEENADSNTEDDEDGDS